MCLDALQVEIPAVTAGQRRWSGASKHSISQQILD
jgi:hypothetical protein